MGCDIGFKRIFYIKKHKYKSSLGFVYSVRSMYVFDYYLVYEEYFKRKDLQIINNLIK